MIKLELSNSQALKLFEVLQIIECSADDPELAGLESSLYKAILSRLDLTVDKPLFNEYTPESELPPMNEEEVNMIYETPTPRVIQAIKSYRARFPGLTLKQAKYKSDTYR